MGALEIMWARTGKECVATVTELFIAADVFPVELLAYQVPMVCVGNWSR